MDDHFLFIVIFFIFFLLTNAQIESGSSVTDQSWFWPLLSISLALLLSIPTILMIVVFICYKKHKSNDDDDDDDDSEQSSIHSNSSTLERQDRHSYHIQGFRSPPPPYTTCDRPANLFMTSSPPPSYDSHINENHPTNPPPPSALEISSTLTSPSIQTFQA